MNRSIRFLLVEDNEDHAEIVKRTFGEYHLANTLVHVPSGEQALKLLRQEDEYADQLLPDVVLLDINLPGISGLEVLRIIKEDPVLRVIPVVMLTTSQAERDLHESYQNHANSFVSKPIDFASMTQVVKDLGFYWAILNHRGGTK